MQLITYSSNPEGAAAYDTGTKVHIFHSVKKPFSSGTTGWDGKKFHDLIIPSKSFKKLCEQFKSDGHASLKVEKKKLSVHKVCIFNKTGKIVPSSWLSGANINKLNNKKTSDRIKLSYGSQWVYLWGTTWNHILSNMPTCY